MLIYLYLNTTIEIYHVTGVQRVTCEIADHLYKLGINVVPFTYDLKKQSIRSLNQQELAEMNRKKKSAVWTTYNLDNISDIEKSETHKLILITELPDDYYPINKFNSLLNYVTKHKNRYKLACMYYDDVPIEVGHIPHYITFKDRFRKWYIEQILAKCDIIFTDSHYQKDRLQKVHIPHFKQKYPHIQIAQVLAMPLAVSSTHFKNFKRIKYNLNPISKQFHILVLCTIEARKNHIPLIRAIKLLNKVTNLECYLHLVGTTFPEWKYYVQQIQEELSDTDKVIMHGRLSDSELDSIYQKIQLTCYPSISEGCGLPIIESVAKGIPCMYLPAGAMEEYATAGCIPINTTDTYAIFLKLYELFSHPQRLFNLYQQLPIVNIYTWEQYVERLINHLRSHF